MTKHKHYIDSIYYDLQLTSDVMKVLGNQVFEKLNLGITPLEHAALDTIFCNAGICQRDLAKLIFKDRANTGRILDSLEEKGFITRFIDLKKNRLVKKMGVTEKGHKKLEEINEIFETYFKDLETSVNAKEIEKLQKSLKKLRESLLEIVNTNI